MLSEVEERRTGARKMQISLTPEQEQFIAEKLASGAYQTPVEVIGEGLRLLREQDEQRQKLEELRRDIDVGIEEARQGLVAPLDARATLECIRQRRQACAGNGE
jgi:putative addiction module CopG family antidote